MRTDQNRKSYITAAGTLLNCVLSVGAAAQEASDAVPSSTAESSRVVAAQIEPDLQRFVDQQPRLPDQAQHILVRVTPAPRKGIVWIDLDAGYLPKTAGVFGEDFGEAVRAVENEGYELIGDSVRFKYIKVRIGGRDLNQIYPAEHLRKHPAT
ncbi:hypothetical protein ADT26_14905 [Xanthomonas oryzae]|uniref:hypothetical protein n=1 Tax=Xanthomonas oryzae TaxID=347 RepID=UPI000465EDA8|nr:hypothetical protein [Xanthomonas oryzae]ALS93357.1 hypothetical protein AXO1947_01020 [Xanthomonas oryzae pv. oryzae]AUI92089.1 hypothetical protein BVV16_21560 [Xanthomonas oryzae pv. oryzae]AUI95767.1 hypothetical protein BVV17_21595 [Xanthomonas oryzae pv. oryzae]AUI99440.1 hypothetical protein BVV18_21600 [Xanthomonas oryzae pv. oryzae]AUJ03117.1 hypothetical protein BVV10_21560 [Xanthomonas oryzae pv. oryzae]